MISGGAAFTFAVLALVAGVCIGLTIPRRNYESDDRDAGSEWGGIGKAAAAAYRGAHADTLERALQINLTSEMIFRPGGWALVDGPGGMALVDAAGFRRLTGVDAETVLAALGRQA